MDTIDNLEKTIQKNELAIKELTISIESLSNQVDQLLQELNVSSEQLTAFIENKNNFSEENWRDLIKMRQDLEEKLLRELANIKNPQKTKKAFAERKVQPHWLFVR